MHKRLANLLYCYWPKDKKTRTRGEKCYGFFLMVILVVSRMFFLVKRIIRFVLFSIRHVCLCRTQLTLPHDMSQTSISYCPCTGIQSMSARSNVSWLFSYAGRPLCVVIFKGEQAQQQRHNNERKEICRSPEPFNESLLLKKLRDFYLMRNNNITPSTPNDYWTTAYAT